MFEDDSSDDPDNPYPPGTDGPRVDIPSVDIPSVDRTMGEIGDSQIASLFLLHVLLWNAVLLLLSLGAMLIYFRGDTATGSQLLAAGVVLTVYGLYRLPDTDSD